MHSLAEPVGTAVKNVTFDPQEKNKIRRILISRPNNRLGNLLLLTPLIQEITQTFPECKIDLFVRGGHAKTLFKNYENVDRIIELPGKPFKDLAQYLNTWIQLRKHSYDLVINVDGESASGKLSTRFVKSRHKIFANAPLRAANKEEAHMAKKPVFYLKEYLNQIGIAADQETVPDLDLKLSEIELSQGNKILRELVQNDRPSIGIFTYATGAKRYSEEWWRIFYERLQLEFKDFNIVEILPAEHVSQIGFQAPVFYSKDVREIGSVMANMAVFIGADSGIMHLASASGTPTIGLFSVSNMIKYQPFNAFSKGVNTNISSLDECIRIIRNVLQH